MGRWDDEARGQQDEGMMDQDKHQWKGHDDKGDEGKMKAPSHFS
jgi:hypothetical protein